MNLIGFNNYQPIKYSNIYLNISDFYKIQNKTSNLNNFNGKKRSKKNKNINQRSFYFEDYLETNKKKIRFKQSNNLRDRIYLLFFFFFSLILIFSIKITNVALDKKSIFNTEKQTSQFSLERRDIVDRNGVIISRNVKTFHAAINPNLIRDNKNFLIKLRINFPDLSIDEIEKKIKRKIIFE